MTLAPPAPSGVWRPYIDEPLLTPAIVDGTDALTAPDLDRLRRYLSALVSTRGGPVHTAVAFNALYFGYDLAGQGYGGSPLDPDAFPVVTLGECIPAIPVGAMVRIATSSQPLYAEVVYKEGRHPATGPLGDVPQWVSGAPAGAERSGAAPRPGDTPVRRELLVPDVHAFGGALSLTDVQLGRLRLQQRWIDRNGHVVVNARYPSPETAGQDALSAYADYLLHEARSQLLSPAVPVSLVDLMATDDDALLHGALVRMLRTIASVLNSCEKLRCWGSYALPRSTLAATWQDDGPLGRGDMSRLATSLQLAGQATSRRRRGMPATTPVYTAIGPWLTTVTGAAPLLTGVDYAAAVCRANLAVADVVRGESRDGLFENGTRVCLDDAFEGGGVWQSRRPGAQESTVGDPLTPSGLGWRAASQPPASRPVHSTPVPAPTSEPLPRGTVPDDAPDLTPVDAPLGVTGAAQAELLRVSDSEVVWRLPLRLAHIMDGFLPLRPLITDELRAVLHLGDGRIRLELNHEGGEIEESERVQDTAPELSGEPGRLSGIDWPLTFFPGIELLLQWPRGGRVIRATTMLLATPVTVDGNEIRHHYSKEILTRESAPGSSRDSDSATGLGERDLVMRAVRRCGLLTVDGHALLARSALPDAVYGEPPAVQQTSALEAAVDQLIAAARLYPATGSRDLDGRPHYPARPDEPAIPLIGYAPAVVQAQRTTPTPANPGHGWHTLPKPYQVHGFLRRLSRGAEPSDAQRAAYRWHCRKLGKADGWELPSGYTFVTEHIRAR
ncbi:hypothetical protein [Kitasatospora mediocidica]|uniref:hypothetical protein n=1 Tax=Kitasatospora mediocidica TaxID=58352 RepID=UPI0006902BA7|nr:hypothetical protein [Kitasatospora mediocidica]